MTSDPQDATKMSERHDRDSCASGYGACEPEYTGTIA